MKKRVDHTSGFKSKVVLEALPESETIQETGKKYNIHPNQIFTWKIQFLSRANSIFEKGATKNDDDGEKAELFKKQVNFNCKLIS